MMQNILIGMGEILMRIRFFQRLTRLQNLNLIRQLLNPDNVVQEG